MKEFSSKNWNERSPRMVLKTLTPVRLTGYRERLLRWMWCFDLLFN